MSATPLPDVNLNNNRGPHLIRSVAACSFLAGVSMAGRIASRKLLKSHFLASDYWITAGLIGSWIVSAVTIAGERHGSYPSSYAFPNIAAVLGLGKHIEMVSPKNLKLMLKVCLPLNILLDTEMSEPLHR